MASESVYRQLTDDILERIEERAREAAAWSDGCRAFREELQEHRLALFRQGEAAGPFVRPLALLRAALERMVLLGHDMELVLNEQSALRRSGLNLQRLVPTVEREVGLGLRLRIAQDGVAQVVHRSGPDCLVVPDGYAAIDIPLEIRLQDQAESFRVNACLGLRTPLGRRDAFLRFQYRRVHVCPPSSLDPLLEEAMIAEADKAFADAEGVLPLPALPALPFGEPAFYGGRFGDLISLPATIRKRPRRAVARTASLPDWADSALKLVPEVVVSYVAREIRKTGAEAGSVRFLSADSFDIDASRSWRYSRRIGCTDFKIKVIAALVIRCQVIVASRPFGVVLQIKIRDVSKDVKVEIRPRVLDSLVRHFLDKGENLAEGLIRGIQRTDEYYLPGVVRAEVNVGPQGIFLLMRTRELPI